MRFLPTLCLLLLLSALALAQTTDQPDPLRPGPPDSTAVNTPADSLNTTDGDENDQADLSPTALRYRLTTDGTVTSGNINRTLLQLTGAIDRGLGKQWRLSSAPSFVYGKQSGFLNERELFGDVRLTFRSDRRLYYLAFGSFEQSNLRQILSRWIGAAGVGFKLLNRQRTYISLTDVLLHETTDYAELNDINLWRNSARLYGQYRFDNDRWTVSHTTFWQPALNGSGNVRWNASVSLQVQVTKVLGVRTTLVNSYESLVVPGRVNNDLRWTMGLVYEKK